MVELANWYGQGTMGVREIAARQGVPERFLEQQMGTLRKAGLLVSQRGAQGGVALARPPQEITIFEIVEALEGPVAPVTCVASNAPDCAKSAHCAVQDLWSQVNVSIKQVLKGTTLDQLTSRQNRYDQAKKPMYYI